MWLYCFSLHSDVYPFYKMITFLRLLCKQNVNFLRSKTKSPHTKIFVSTILLKQNKSPKRHLRHYLAENHGLTVCNLIKNILEFYVKSQARCSQNSSAKGTLVLRVTESENRGKEKVMTAKSWYHLTFVSSLDFSLIQSLSLCGQCQSSRSVILMSPQENRANSAKYIW